MPASRASSLICLAVLASTVLSGCTGFGNPPPKPQDLSRSDFTLTLVASGLETPVFVTDANDGSERLFVVEQDGVVRIIKGGVVRDAPFLDIRDLVKSGGERGLLSIAFSPRYAMDGRVFASYTNKDGDSRVDRFTVDASDADRADPASRVQVLAVPQPYSNHNGGMIAFGPDGFLYVGLGDGGSAGDPQGHGQNVDSLLGAILRLDVAREGGNYGIPQDNPFVGKAGRDEVWAFGLRNPWRFSFDRVTGDLWIGDVGQNSLEEIDFEPAESGGGKNYGWNVWEGSERHREGETSTPAVSPVVAYGRAGGQCSVTGGYRYRGVDVPILDGVYLYADYCSGTLWGLTPSGDGWTSRELAKLGFRVSSFGEDSRGEMYVVDHGGGVHKFVMKMAEA